MTKNNLLSVLQAIGSLSTDGVLLYHFKDQRIEYVNDALARMFDISHESFRYQSEFFINHIIEEDLGYLSSEIDRLIKEQKVENIEFTIKLHDESVRNILASCYLLERGKYVVGIFKNITESRERENYIINYGAKKDQLLEMITHNLSGPLALSRNMITSLEKAVKGANGNNVSEHIKLIKDNTSHCIDIVTDFLEEEHLVSEQIFIKKNRFELIEKIYTVLERCEKSYPEFKFVFKTSAEKIYLNNDDLKFLQVLNNLISNAVKWSPSGNCIEIIVTETDQSIEVAVKDYGVGIPGNLQPLLFQRNTPASRPGLRDEKSIGMGLYIVRRLLALMDATITIESEENKGTTATITFDHPKA